jgi:glycine/D-amino acid oxidase-like deaminating enzyme
VSRPSVRRGETDVCIIGGGLVGCAAAHYLRERGVDCLVVERDEINRGGSGTNAGSLHIQIRALEAAFSDATLAEMLPLKAAAAQAWSELEHELGCPLGVYQRGGLMVAETDEQMAVVRATVAREHQFGLPVEVLSAGELRALAPSLSHHLVGAAFCPLEGLANPLQVTLAFARRALAAGTPFWTHTRVNRISRLAAGEFEVITSRGTIVARRILDAAGAWGGAVARLAGVDLAIVGKIIQVSVTERRPPTLYQLLGSIEGGITLKQTPAGMYLIGGGWPAATDPESNQIVLDRTSVAGNIGLALRLVPGLGDALLLRSWTGPIAQAYDVDGQLLQVLGEAPDVPGFYILGGGMLFTLGPLYARLMAELMVGGSTSMPIALHDPARFARRVRAEPVASLTL